ncbi:hypothetical protein [Brevibacillus sp. SYSU BS000544]
MSGLVVFLIGIGVVLLFGYFMTKWERVVFPGNQEKTGQKPKDQKKL